MTHLISCDDRGLTHIDHAAVRSVLGEAFGARFDEHDWEHSVGGWRILLFEDSQLVSTAAVVDRELLVDAVPYDVGYVEAVATLPAQQRRGFAGQVMTEAAKVIATRTQFGALSSSKHGFYERFGWQRWRGRTFVLPRNSSQPLRTADEDAGLMVLLAEDGPAIELTADIWCHERAGDDW